MADELGTFLDGLASGLVFLFGGGAVMAAHPLAPTSWICRRRLSTNRERLSARAVSCRIRVRESSLPAPAGRRLRLLQQISQPVALQIGQFVGFYPRDPDDAIRSQLDPANVSFGICSGVFFLIRASRVSLKIRSDKKDSVPAVRGKTTLPPRGISFA